MCRGSLRLAGPLDAPEIEVVAVLPVWREVLTAVRMEQAGVLDMCLDTRFILEKVSWSWDIRMRSHTRQRFRKSILGMRGHVKGPGVLCVCSAEWQKAVSIWTIVGKGLRGYSVTLP